MKAGRMRMDVREFRQRYGYYRADSRGEAEIEAVEVNKEGVEGDTAIVVEWGSKWTVRLEVADKPLIELFG